MKLEQAAAENVVETFWCWGKKSDFRQQEHCNRRCLCRHLHLFFYIGNMNRSFRRIKPRIFLKIFLLNGFLHRIFPWTLQRGVYLYNLGLTNSKTNIKVQWVLLLKNFKTLTPKSTILTHTILTCFSHASKELKGKYFPWRRDYVKYRLWLKSLHAEEELAAQGTHCYSGSIFANSTREDHTKVVCTGEYGSCHSTESWEYFHLNIQYWNLNGRETRS